MNQKQTIALVLAIIFLGTSIWVRLTTLPPASTQPAPDNVAESTATSSMEEGVGVEGEVIKDLLVEPENDVTPSFESALDTKIEELDFGINTDGENIYLNYSDYAMGEPTTLPLNGRDYEIIKSELGESIHIRIGQDVYALSSSWIYLAYFVELQDLDVQSFTVIGQGYARDKNHVYFHGVILKDGDPDSFSLLSTDEPFAQDKTHVYYADEILVGVNPDSARAQVIPGSEEAQGGEIILLLTTDSVYYQADKLEGIRPLNFTTKRHGVIIEDGDTVYWMTGGCHGGRWYVPKGGDEYIGWC